MKKLNILLAFLFITQIIVSQTIYTNSDTIPITENSIQLVIPEHRGEVQWQYSNDSIQWITMTDETSDTLLTNLIDTTGYFRAQILEGNCLPIYTGMASLRNRIPEVSTFPIVAITENSAKLTGEVIDEGGSNITSTGFYLSANNAEPDINDFVVEVDNGIGNFEKTMTGLQANTTYYVRSFAINKKGTAYGDVYIFKTILNLASVSTGTVTDIEAETATLNGEVTDSGGKTITSRGFYWSATDRSPDANDSYVLVDGTLGDFSASIGNLQPYTTYYAVAFATTASGTALGNVQTFKTKVQPTSGNSITYEGKTYKIVEIGTQWWMAENLAYLPSVSPKETGSITDPLYYVYGYSGTNVQAAKATTNYASYGVLYNWEAAKTACPTGWHLPSDSEWETLAEFISDDNGGYTKDGSGFWSIVGKHLQAKSGWFQAIGTDDYGFAALPGGYRGYGYEEPNFDKIDFWGYYGMAGFASSTSFNDENAWGRLLVLNNDNLLRLYREKFSATSVRCVKD